MHNQTLDGSSVEKVVKFFKRNGNFYVGIQYFCFCHMRQKSNLVTYKIGANAKKRAQNKY